MTFTPKVHSALKNLAMIWLPALATLYGSVSAVVGLPKAAAVIGVIVALDTFLGMMLGVAVPPAHGNLVVDKSDPSKDVYRFELGTAIEELEKLGTFVVRVVHSVPETPVVTKS
jgi:hypothetical protein